jgi:hypothetical protein
MKFFVVVMLTALLGFALCLYLPWWGIAPAAFLVAVFLYLKPGLSFLAGFMGIFLLWALLITQISLSNDHILAHKISIIILKKDSPVLLILISALIGGVIAGFAALSGSLLHSIIRKPQPVE